MERPANHTPIAAVEKPALVEREPDFDLAEALGFHPEQAKKTQVELESMFGPRIFRYGEYSGTVTRMAESCPAFIDVMERGTGQAAAWLEINDETQEEVVPDEPEPEKPPQEQDQQTEELARPKVEQPVVQSAESDKAESDASSSDTGHASSSADDVAPSSTASKQMQDNSLPTAPALEVAVAPNAPDEQVGDDTLAAIIEDAVEVDQDARTDTTDMVDQSAIIIEQVEAPKILADQETEVLAEPIATAEVAESSQEVTEDLVVVNDEEELAGMYELPTVVDGEDDDMSLDVAAEQESDEAILEQESFDRQSDVLTMEEILATQQQDTIEQLQELTNAEVVEPEAVETVISLVGETPNVFTEVASKEVYRQVMTVIQNIEVLEKVRTAEECREAIDELRIQITELLALLGYTNADVIAQRLMKQYNIAELKEYLVLLLQTLRSSQASKTALSRTLKTPAAYYLYGIHAVRTVVRIEIQALQRRYAA